MHGVLGFIGVVFLLLLTFAMNKAHYEQTGVRMPSRSAMRGIRRRGRKKGLNEWEAYEQWLKRKQAKLPTARFGQAAGPVNATPVAVEPEPIMRFPGRPRGWLGVGLAFAGTMLAILAYLLWVNANAVPTAATASADAGSATAAVPIPRARPAAWPLQAPLDIRPPGAR